MTQENKEENTKEVFDWDTEIEEDEQSKISDYLAMVTLFLLICFSTIIVYTNKSIKDLEIRVVKLEIERSNYIFQTKLEPFSSIYKKDSFEIKLMDKVSSGTK